MSTPSVAAIYRYQAARSWGYVDKPDAGVSCMHHYNEVSDTTNRPISNAVDNDKPRYGQDLLTRYDTIITPIVFPINVTRLSYDITVLS